LYLTISVYGPQRQKLKTLVLKKITDKFSPTLKIVGQRSMPISRLEDGTSFRKVILMALKVTLAFGLRL